MCSTCALSTIRFEVPLEMTDETYPSSVANLLCFPASNRKGIKEMPA